MSVPIAPAHHSQVIDFVEYVLVYGSSYFFSGVPDFRPVDDVLALRLEFLSPQQIMALSYFGVMRPLVRPHSLSISQCLAPATRSLILGHCDGSSPLTGVLKDRVCACILVGFLSRLVSSPYFTYVTHFCSPAHLQYVKQSNQGPFVDIAIDHTLVSLETIHGATALLDFARLELPH